MALHLLIKEKFLNPAEIFKEEHDEEKDKKDQG
jgi:uncharacterized protein YqgQ